MRTATDAQVRKLMEEMSKHGEVGLAAMKAGMDRKTARKYLRAGKLPSEMKVRADVADAGGSVRGGLGGDRGEADGRAGAGGEDAVRGPGGAQAGQVQPRGSCGRCSGGSSGGGRPKGPDKEVFFAQAASARRGDADRLHVAATSSG